MAAASTTTKYKPAQWRSYCPACTMASVKEPQLQPRVTVETKRKGVELTCGKCGGKWRTA